MLAALLETVGALAILASIAVHAMLAGAVD